MRARSRRSARKSTTTPATMWACSTTVLAAGSTGTQLAGRAAAPPRRRRTGRRRPRDVRGEERARPVRRRQDLGRHVRRGRGHHRRRLDRPGLRDRDGAGLRRRCSASTIARVRVVHGQTDRIAFGIGAHASRATVMTASATRIAALKRARQGARGRGASCMQAAPDDLDIVDGMVGRKDAAGASIDQPRRRRDGAAPTSKTLAGREPGLSAEGWFNVEHQVYPYGSHVAVVKVDPDTGGVADRALPHRLRHRPRHQSRCWSRARSSAASPKGWAAR